MRNIDVVDDVLEDLVLTHLVQLVDDVVVLQEEGDAVLVRVDRQLLEQQLAALRHGARPQRRRVIGADAVVLIKVLGGGALSPPCGSGHLERA